MTDNEIIKALECCIDCSSEYCSECPYVECTTRKVCTDEMITDALALINRQKEEIRRLKEDVDDLEIKVEHLAVFLAEARHDAVKEFAEIVKEKIRTMSRIVVYDEDIDNLVKEFTEGG